MERTAQYNAFGYLEAETMRESLIRGSWLKVFFSSLVKRELEVRKVQVV
jgi:hypothetical protein